MMIVHEAGHCLGALLTGGTIQELRIPLIGFSSTHVTDSRSPLLVVWLGPIVGALLPLLLLLIRRPPRSRHIATFVAGFCLIANGLYIGVGVFDRVGDCVDLLHHGAHPWQLILFGIIATLSGFAIWHMLGPIGQWFSSHAHD